MLCTSVHIILSPCWQDFVPSTQCAAFIAQFAAAEEAAATPAAVNDGSKDEPHAERQNYADPFPMRFMPSASEDGSAELQSEGEVPSEPHPTVTAPAASAVVANHPAASSLQVQAAAITFSAHAARAAVTPDAACQTAERVVNNSSSSGSSSGSDSGSDASTSDSDSGVVQEAADGVPGDGMGDGSMQVPGCEVEADDDAAGAGDGQLSSPDPAAAADSQVGTVNGG